MTDTATIDLTTLEIPEIEVRWQEAMIPAARLEAQMNALRAQSRRYRKWGGRYVAQADRFWEEADEIENGGALNEAYLAEAPFREEWDRRGGWTRYWLVVGGHLHHMSCSTITPGRTLIGLLCAASGMDDGEVVREFQYTACTHCFPDAPVEAGPPPGTFCEMSGQYAGEHLCDPKWGNGHWTMAAVAPAVECPECGWTGAITKAGRFRKHKPETQE